LSFGRWIDRASEAGCRWAWAVVAVCAAAFGAGAEDPTAISLNFESGGSAVGPILDSDDRVVVIHYQGLPCAFDYDELTVASAYQTRKKILADLRGGLDALEGADHLALGRYALSRGHVVVANNEFKMAVRLDPDLSREVQALRREFRAKQKQARRPQSRHNGADLSFENETAANLPGVSDLVGELDPADFERITEAYRRFGAGVRDEINSDLELVETEHFLIWTDWRPLDRPRLAAWCEGMYAALCRKFSLAESGHIFLGKCPIFCFRSKAGFLRFLRTFEHNDSTNLVGYAITQPNGHVHVSTYLRGPSDYELKRFAATLVHEGAHGFLHRYQTTGNISGWLGEGLADLMAQEVLAEDCTYGRQAKLIARQYVARNLPISDLLRTVHTLPPAAQYPLAHSVVRFLIETDTHSFADMLADIKRLRDVEGALQRHFGGMDFNGLEEQWRDYVRNDFVLKSDRVSE
jgi:hypothetical protein